MAYSYEYEVTVNMNDTDLQKDIDVEADEDKNLAAKVAFRLSEAKPVHDERCKIAKENMNLFDGKLEEVSGGAYLAKYQSKSLKNVLFLTIRNLVGLSTDNPPMPDVAPAKDTPQSQQRALVIGTSLENDMTRTRFNDRLGGLLFDTYIKTDSYIHWFWNFDANDNDFVECTVEEISIAPGAKSIHDSEYTIYHPWKNRKWWKDNWADFYDQIKFENPDKASGSKEDQKGRGQAARFISYWEDDVRIEQVMGKNGEWIILKKGKNPYWEYRSTDEQIMEWVRDTYPQIAGFAEEYGLTDEASLRAMVTDPQMNPEATIGEVAEFEPILNFLDVPTKPFIQIPSIKLVGEMYSKNLIGHAKEAYLELNLSKRQISDNMRGCNTKLIVDTDSLSEEQIEAITDEPNQVIGVSFQNNQKPVYWAETSNFDIQKVLLSMEDDKAYIDDLFGHHEISRGSGNAGTLGQDKMNLESDRTPIRYQVRGVENAIVELWKGWIQLKKMFYTEAHYVKKLGLPDGPQFMQLMSKDIEAGIEPILNPMSTAALSKAAKAEQSLNLWAQGAIDPHTLYVDLGRKNPTGMTNRLVNWQKFGIISEEDPEELLADIQNNGMGEGDGTENPIEQANSENKAMQMGEEVPPTPPTLVNKEHVKLHVQFLQDKNNKMEEDARDNFLNHIEADKATLKQLIKTGVISMDGATTKDQARSNFQGSQPAQQPATPPAEE